MGKVLKADGSAADAWVRYDFGDEPEVWASFELGFTTAALAFWASTESGIFAILWNTAITDGRAGFDLLGATWQAQDFSGETGTTPAPTADAWQQCELHYLASGVSEFYIGGLLVYSFTPGADHIGAFTLGQYAIEGFDPDQVSYFRNVTVGTTRGGRDLFSDDFSSGDLAAWTVAHGTVSVAEDPFAFLGQRVGIAFSDGPLEPDPAWTYLDSDASFPASFVSGYDISCGRQTLLSQTDTGSATVYINDHELGLFDPRNMSSPYFGELDGSQIQLQLYNPVTGIWEPQFRGWIDFATYDIDGSAVNAAGEPINASIQLQCVDVFDYLAGFELTPGLAGVIPTPTGMEDGVYYAESGIGATVQDRIIEVLADVGIDSTRYIVASGNVKVQAVKYDPGESALVALRDACDAEIPFIANMYVNRSGQFVFRGRYSRFYPDDVAREPGSEWDFTRWAVGDGAAIESDSTRAQMRVLSFTRGRQDTINVAICYPQGILAADMPAQVFSDATSITLYGHHMAPPMSDLITLAGVESPTPFTANEETAAFAELLVKNKKGPHVAVSALQIKSIQPTDPRATQTWDALTRIDISHIVNVAVGYPGGTGLTGNSPADDHYVEGRALTVRPTGDETYDYVELNLETTPFEWSADIHGVFPNPFA